MKTNTMRFNEENINKLREGKVTLVADHSKPELMDKVLKEAFPKDEDCYSDFNNYKYYFNCGDKQWDASKHNYKIALMPLKDFFIEELELEVTNSVVLPISLNNEKPKRYASREVNGMDVIDLAEHWNLNFQEANILKYLLRDKGQDYEDMLKIVDYATREAELIKKRNS